VALIQLFSRSVIPLWIGLAFAAQLLPASDIPVEGTCIPCPPPPPPSLGSVPTLSLLTGAGSLFSYDFASHAGSFSDPWAISLGATGLDLVLLFTPTFPLGGALTSPSNTNAIPSAHAYGKYVRITLLDSGPSPWIGVFFDLQTTLGTISDPFDGISFGAPFPPAPQSTEFPAVQVLANANALSFIGGTVLPGQSASFLLPITDSNRQNGPAFFLEAQLVAAPEAPTSAITLAGIALLLAGAIFTSRGGARGPQTGDPGGLDRTSALP
jgi:hypothetical protein